MFDPDAGPSSKRKKVVNDNHRDVSDHEVSDFLQIVYSEEEASMYGSDELSESSEEEDNAEVSPAQTQPSAPALSFHQPAFSTLSWTPDLPRPPPPPIPFTGVSQGFKHYPSGNAPIDYFFHLANEEFFNMILTATNNFGTSLFSESPKPKSRSNSWKPITLECFKIFLGLLFNMGMVKISRLKDYWRSDRVLNVPIFSHCMGRNRFSLIMRCLYFSDINKTQSADRGNKCEPIVNFFNDRMAFVYSPSRELSLDESMILWRGRLVFKQYLKGKRHPYGVKLYMLTEPNGLVVKFIVYAGSQDKKIGGKGHSTNVVKALLDGKLGLGHHVYLDSYYNSVDLAKYLLSESTYVSGSLRPNRKNTPYDVVQAKLKKGEEIHRYSPEGICVLRWKDKRDVFWLSSGHNGSMIDKTNRRGFSKRVPRIEVECNNHMVGIDHQDQMLTYYPIERKTLRWYKKVGIHTLEIMLLNSWYLYKRYVKKMDFFDYRLSIIKVLLGPRLETVPIPQVLPTRVHLPELLQRNDKNRNFRKRCKICYSQGIRKDSTFYCPDCPDKPGLCVGMCFRLYHSY